MPESVSVAWFASEVLSRTAQLAAATVLPPSRTDSTRACWTVVTLL
jgi:hypothetical protein